jgi:hypothetical protein
LLWFSSHDKNKNKREEVIITNFLSSKGEESKEVISKYNKCVYSPDRKIELEEGVSFDEYFIPEVGMKRFRLGDDIPF